MDINQSALSGYQPNNSNNRTNASVRTTSDQKVRDSSSASAAQTGKAPELKEGQLLKGQILDIRYNEVKIQLEPGKQVVTARLSGDVPLSIGQEAQFRVSEESQEHLVLKYTPEGSTSQNASAITKALTASGLPLSEQNRALVSELLNHRMPIDKQTLQSLTRYLLANREASPQTLVLMFKNKLPMTSSNIRQFEAYQNGTGQLLKDIRKVSQNITDILRPNMQSDNSEETAYNPTSSLQNALRMNTGLIDILYNRSSSSSLDLFHIPLKQILEKDELAGLGSAFGKQLSGLPDLSESIYNSIVKQVTDGDLSLTEAIRLLDEFYSDRQTEEIRHSEAQSVQNLLNQLSTRTSSTDSIAAAQTSDTAQAAQTANTADSLLNDFLSQQDTSPMMSTVFTSQERANLSNLLSTLQDSKTINDNIAQGSISLKDVMALITDQLPLLDKQAAAKLLQAPEYSKLLEEAFLKKWTITPEKVAKKDSVANLCQQLQEDLEKLSNLTKSLKTSVENEHIDTPIKSMKENLQFMRDLNDVFTYLQLPIQFKDQTAHTDLYVMTRKKALGDTKENLSVLLHLDMSNLGSLNIYIRMNSANRIQADFYMEDTAAGKLIKENLSSLTDALEKKGYVLDADVKDTYKKPDFSKDFIEQSASDNHIQRLSFDIRT